MNDSGNWEYDAPQYVDFTTGTHPFDECGDAYFNFDHENGVPVDFGDDNDGTIVELIPLTPSQNDGTTTALSKSAKKPTSAKMPATKRAFSAVENTPSMKSTSPEDEPLSVRTRSRATKRKGAWGAESEQPSSAKKVKRSNSVATKKPQEKNTPQRVPRIASASVSSPPQRVPKVDSPAIPPDVLETTTTTTASSRRPVQSTSKDSAPEPPAVAATKQAIKSLTVCTTPTFVRPANQASSSANKQLKSSEEQELEKIAEMKRSVAKKRKQAQDSYKKVTTGGSFRTIKSRKPVTRPIEPHFATDSRVKSHDADTDQSNPTFAGNLRSYQSETSTKNTTQSVTKSVPFLFAEPKRKKPEETISSEKYHSMAETVQAFHKKTPDRFHLTGSKNEKAATKFQPPKLTVPKTPHFEYRTKGRSADVLTQEEREDAELEEMKKNQFKARPMNQKIIDNPGTGVRKVKAKPATLIEEFELTSPQRKERVVEQEEKQEFHANPVPTKILKGIVGIKPAKERPVTMPESPAFALKKRVRTVTPELDTTDAERFKQIKANPIPHTGAPFRPKHVIKRVVSEPFSFDKNILETRQKKEEKKRQMEEEEKKAREFRANPLPASSPDALPTKHVRERVKQAPFNLESEKRGSLKASEWKQKMEEELRQQQEQSKFTANPSTVLQKEAFVPKKAHKPPTEICDFKLNTDRRNDERLEYETVQAQKNLERGAIGQQKQVEHDEEDRQAVARLRTELVHKAQPVRKFKKVAVQGSDKPLTKPESPRFSDRLAFNKKSVHS